MTFHIPVHYPKPSQGDPYYWPRAEVMGPFLDSITTIAAVDAFIDILRASPDQFYFIDMRYNLTIEPIEVYVVPQVEMLNHEEPGDTTATMQADINAFLAGLPVGTEVRSIDTIVESTGGNRSWTTTIVHVTPAPPEFKLNFSAMVIYVKLGER